MKAASNALKAFIPSNRQFFEADLYTLTPGGNPSAAPAYVQSVVVDQPAGTQTSWTYAFGSNVSAGSLLVLTTREGFPSPVSGVSDNQGNTWVNLTTQFWYALNAKAGATTITVAMTSSTHMQGVAAEYSGVANLPPDASAGVVGGTSTLMTSSSIVTSLPGDLVLGWGSNGTTNAPVYTAGSGYTLRSGSGHNAFLEDQVAAAAGSINATLAISTSVSWGIGIVAFKAATPASLRFTTCDRDISWNGNLYSSQGPNFTRGAMKWGLGLTVDTIDVTLDADNTDTYSGVPFLQALARGVFDGARFQIDRLFGVAFGQWVDSVTLFAGNVADVSELGRTRCVFQVRSRLELLNNSLPFNVYQPSCRWTLFSPGCTLSKAAFGVSGTLSGGSTALKLLATLAQASGYFDLGTITFISGPNVGASATIKTYLNGSPSSVLLNVPLANAPQTGDQFAIYPGCDKTMATCNTKFANLIHHGGFEFVPVPETAF